MTVSVLPVPTFLSAKTAERAVGLKATSSPARRPDTAEPAALRVAVVVRS